MRALPTIRLLGWSSLIAWVVASSSATAAASLAYLNSESVDGLVGGILRPILSVLWLPAKLSDRLFGLVILPYHSADDAVANIVAYTLETLFTTFVVATVIQLLWHLRSRILADNKPSA